MARVNQRPSETPAHSSHLSVAPSSVAPSSPNLSSDKENQSDLAPRDKGKGRMQSTTSDSNSAKRRRIQARPTASAARDEELDESRFYDPTQDQHERQEIKKKSRALEREFNGACPCIPHLYSTQSDILQRTGMSTSKMAVGSSPSSTERMKTFMVSSKHQMLPSTLACLSVFQTCS
jgi:hypothetical protein